MLEATLVQVHMGERDDPEQEDVTVLETLFSYRVGHDWFNVYAKVT